MKKGLVWVLIGALLLTGCQNTSESKSKAGEQLSGKATESVSTSSTETEDIEGSETVHEPSQEPIGDSWENLIFHIQDNWRILFDKSTGAIISVGVDAVYDSEPESFSIPEYIDGIKVRGIGGELNRDYENYFWSIYFQNSTYGVVFSQSIKSLFIPAGVSSINESVFGTKLKSIEVSSDNKYFSSDQGVLYSKDKTKLIFYPGEKTDSTFVIPESVTSIENGAFYSCENLESIILPAGLARIGDTAFHACTNLKSIIIPDTVTSIGDNAFYGCGALESIEISLNNPIYYSKQGVLYNKEKKELVAYPSGKADTAFSIPDGVVSIGNNAFYNGYLTDVSLPDSIARIGESAFSNCSSLSKIEVSAGNKSFSSEQGVLYNKDKTSLIAYPRGITDSAFVIPSSVKRIESGAFSMCMNLADIILPSGLESIGQSSFVFCSIESINIPDGVISIGNAAFNLCYKLTDVILPASVTSIGNFAFQGCSSLNSINLPEGIDSIGDRAFYNCRSLTSISLPAGVTSIGDNAFNRCTGLQSISLPAGLTSIGNGAFYECESLTSISLPDSVVRIGNGTFSGCDSLTSISIPSKVTSIGTESFFACENLTSISLPAGVTSIGSFAFAYCDSLTVITVPVSVSSIGSYPFPDDISIRFCGSEEEWKAINKGDKFIKEIVYDWKE